MIPLRMIWCELTGECQASCLHCYAGSGPGRGHGAFFRDFPQQPHRGRCRTFFSGRSDSSIVAPGWPSGLPGFRPDLPRSDFGDGLAGPSDDGGFDEFREFAFTWAARHIGGT
jgi:hypothetical protein